MAKKKQPAAFGPKLQAARLARGWSQSDLAARAEMPISTLQHLERGASQPRPETARKLAEALEVRITWDVVAGWDLV